MKKTIAAILAGALCLTALTACGGSKTDSAAADSSAQQQATTRRHRWRYPDSAR